MRKVIITCSLTGGVQSKAANPNLPEQPDEIAQQVMSVATLGIISMPVIKRQTDRRPGCI
jgi:3-keto-5-aminohexanoate cleavage enzyme